MPNYPDPQATNEQLFEQYGKLVYWVANMIARRNPSLQVDDTLGEVWMQFKKCVKGFDPALGFRFSSYFTRSVLHKAKRWLILDREWTEKCSRREEDRHKAMLDDNYHRGHGHLWRTPEDDWTTTIIDGLFDGDTVKLWESLTEPLTPRMKDVILWRFGDGLTLEACAARLDGISKERVRQIQVTALERMRKKTETYIAAAKLFGEVA